MEFTMKYQKSINEKQNKKQYIWNNSMCNVITIFVLQCKLVAYTGVYMYMYNYCKEINFQNIQIKWERNHLSLSKTDNVALLLAIVEPAHTSIKS